MPKENINDMVQDDWRFEVSWKPDETYQGGTTGHVQVASVNQASTFMFPEDEDGKVEGYDGWRVTLDADGLDRAILALNRARKMAFPDDTDDLLHEAWGLICNASNRTIDQGGPVDASPGWAKAASRWRDRYHARLRRDSVK
jgi:hypothetical protein